MSPLKLVLALILLLTNSRHILAQTLKSEDIVGTWKVVNAELNAEVKKELDAAGLKKAEQMRVAFIGTLFTFNANHVFNIKFPPNSPDFINELTFLNNNKWKIDNQGNILVGSEKDGYSLMRMQVYTQGGKKYLVMEETFLVLEIKQ